MICGTTNRLFGLLIRRLVGPGTFVAAAFLAAAFPGAAVFANGLEETRMPYPAPRRADPRFDTLDAYLAFLRQNGPMGLAWYRLRDDGLYERIARRPRGTPPELFTRQELLDRFGYTR